MNPDRTEPDNSEVTLDEAKELAMDDIDQVSGAGNPFEDVPRVPLKPIDDKLRENG